MSFTASVPDVVRSRLLRSVATTLSRGHVLVSAPAGYGKSTLLQQLARQRPDTHYVQLTSEDLDLARLQAQLLPHLRPSATIMLDDIHELAGAADVLAWISEIARAVRVHFVLSGRLIPIASSVLGPPERVAVLTQRDLAFTLQESQVLLAASGPSPEKTEAWHARLNGWPLALALLAREQDLDATVRPEDVVGQTSRSLFDYLASTLWSRLPAPLKEFMALSAAPLRFNDELAADLLGLDIDEAASRRAEVQRRNLFLSDVPTSPGWHQYHDLVRSFLIEQLPDLGRSATESLGLASRWFDAHGEPAQAIDHALIGGLFADAARLLERLPVEFVRNGQRHSTFRRWVLGLDEATLATHPLLLERLGYDLLDIGRFGEAHEHLDRASRLAEILQDLTGLHRIRLTRAKAYSVVGQPERALDLCRLALADPQLPAGLRRQGLNTTGNAAALLSRFREARAAYLGALEIPEQPESLPNPFIRANLVNVVLSPLGDFELGERLLNQDRGYFATHREGSSVYLMAWAALNESRADWAALRAVVAEIEAVEAQAEQADDHDVWTPWFKTMALIGSGDLIAARQSLAVAAGVASDHPEELLCVALADAWLLRREGRPAEAEQRALAALAQDWPSPQYRALLAIEVDLARSALDPCDTAPLLSDVRALTTLRVRPHLLRLRALLAVRAWRRHDARASRHARAVLRGLQRPGFTGLLTRRDPELAEAFWSLCVAEDLAVAAASAELKALGRAEPLIDLLREADPRVRERAARGLAEVGRETAMPALAAALTTENDAAASREIGAALSRLESAPPPLVRVQLLGEFVLQRGERVVTTDEWTRPAVRRLFQYLALHHDRRLTRDQILDDLWPDADPAAARASLNQLISWLRKVLEPHMRPRAASRYLWLEDERYALGSPHHPGAVRTDVDDFDAAVRPFVEAAPHADVAPLPARLLSALENWKPLLPEVPYEAWVQSERERLQSLYLDGCLYVSRALLDQGRPGDALAWAHRVVRQGPWIEEGYQELMRAQARLGQRSHALKSFGLAVEALQRELGAEPSALTRWLAQRLQQGQDI